MRSSLLTRTRWPRLLLACLAAILTVRTVQAHAELVTSEPAPGTVLTDSPRLIQLHFSEPLRPGSDIVLYGSGFRVVAGVEAAVDLTEPTRLIATLPELSPDKYTVQWTSLSIDGDQLSGSYSFGIRADTPRPVPYLETLVAILLVVTLFAGTVAASRRGSRSTAP